ATGAPRAVGGGRSVPPAGSIPDAHNPEAIIGVAELGRQGAAGRAAGDLDLMPPGAAARGAPDSALGSRRIPLGADPPVVGPVPVEAPLVDVVGHGVQAEAVGWTAHDLRAGGPAAAVVTEVAPGFGAPRIGIVASSPAGALALGLGRQPVPAAGALAEPVA